VGKLRLYARYTTRSLRRGGQRTVLGIFCIAVGVMAVVALRLAGDMISASLISNVRAANGGDVSLVSTAIPLAPADLLTFTRLQQQGEIRQFVALGVERTALRRDGGKTSAASLYVLDNPALYPLAGNAGFAAPSDATFASSLAGPNAVVLTQFMATTLGAGLGETVHLNLVGGGSVDARVSAILTDRLASAVGTSSAFIDATTYRELSAQPESYGVIQMTTATDAQAAHVASQLQTQFPAATVQTVQQALKANVQASQQVTQYLEIIGLLALAIGGIGIVNTLQVMLSRRRVEIAMLKATGYRRGHLYAMFGLEVAILGLLGGVLGSAAGIAMSLVVKTLIEQVIDAALVFQATAGAVLAGVAVGVVTSLIFGLLPVVRAAAIRPQEVLRDQPAGRQLGSAAQTLALYAVVAALFVALAASILGDFFLALQVVLYTLVGLLILAGIFSLIVLIVGHLPVPERFTSGYVVLVSCAIAVAALITLRLQGVGLALLVATVSGFIVVLLPRSQRTVVKLALRSIGRARARAATTLVALFVGVFTIGLILVVGKDISDEIGSALSNLASYNVFVIASSRDAASAGAATEHLAGLQGRRVTQDLGVKPLAVNGTPFGQLIGTSGGTSSSGSGVRREGALFELLGVEGYDLARGESPGPTIAQGRALGPADAGSSNVLVLSELRNAPLHLKPGDQVLVGNAKSNATLRLTVVGFYMAATRSSNGSIHLNFFFEPILADKAVVEDLGSSAATSIDALKLDPSAKLADLRTIQTAVPGATVFDLSDLGALVQQVLGNLVDLLIGIASLALFAGAVIIANTVALAMLERRREIGILKATGYTSRSVLAQVLVENGVVGGIGAVTGMVMVSVATALLGNLALKTSLAVSTPIVLGVIGGIVVLAMAVSGLVAWGPSRVRPLEVLRYE